MNLISSRISFWRNILSKRFYGDASKKKLECENKKAAASAPAAPKKPKLKKFKIYRYNPEDKGKKPTMQTYTIDLNDCRPMILDALNKIKSEQDSSLTYRRSCREGICGSCGMNIDGINRLACLYKIKPKGTTKIYPLPHMYVIKDLVVDFNKFLEQHSRIKPYLIRKSKEQPGTTQYLQSIKDRESLDGYIECILCACCATSCPEYWWHGHTKKPNDFLGPAALLHAYRWIMDSRDHATADRIKQLTNYYNIYRCHQINNCTSCCPKRLAPGVAIANLRLLVGGFKKKNKPDMDGAAPAEPEKACKVEDEDKCSSKS
ncbi:succinate dehydrogenase [ubiquinone] iron-sulfur subunit-like [Anoplophora glabripennis]|uniref:succinate dehydrogenase [ubiquinone] iron-sulfur subunit-like n=1 Tax=Anoplophora glabripennis TaxID=217634 RepID=UPI0008747244|nr:succinate dehydrogenase [ubiquinone] iron-sulfur subunit-like [Anoplophora glabripennis]